MEDSLEKNKQAEELAIEILKLSRNTLMLNLRFLDTALIQFVPSPWELTRELATDGRYLYFNIWHVLNSYKKSKEKPVRDYLHVTLHCLFRHLFFGRKIRSEIWDLSCDIAVENVINGLDLRSVSCERAKKQTDILMKLNEEIHPLTAEKLYRYFMDQKLPSSEYEHLRYHFYADDHTNWHEEAQGDESSSNSGGDTENGKMDNSKIMPEETETEESTEPWQEGEEKSSPIDGLNQEEKHSGSGEGSMEEEEQRKGDQPGLTREELEQLWKNISERVQVDLETSSSTWGNGAGDMMQELRSVNREKYDYSGFLRRFSVLGENTEINDEEFDYIFYTYGIELYKNMPLVEPLEYKEVKRIREFVVALDTSQSVSGDMVQKFVNKTYNILKQTDSFFTKTNIHILQCGAAVMEDAKITCHRDFDEYISRMQLKGFGGTDFRPVFKYVDEMIAYHELTNFKGLIYFTDGYGTFPEKKPNYDAAFIFVSDANDTPEVPTWAIKLVLTPEELDLF